MHTNPVGVSSGYWPQAQMGEAHEQAPEEELSLPGHDLQGPVMPEKELYVPIGHS